MHSQIKKAMQKLAFEKDTQSDLKFYDTVFILHYLLNWQCDAMEIYGYNIFYSDSSISEMNILKLIKIKLDSNLI